MNTPLKGPVQVDAPAQDKKMRGVATFFRGAWATIQDLLRAHPQAVVTAVRTAAAQLGQSLSPSGLYELVTRRDMAENYMLSAGRMPVQSTGGIYLLLRVNCAQPASFAFFAAPQGRREKHWFNNENDTQAVPMQPKELNGGKPDNFGSSGRRPANMNGTYQQPT